MISAATMLSVAALATSAVGVGRNSRARARKAHSAAMRAQTTIAPRWIQTIQPKLSVRPISLRAPSARTTVTVNSTRRTPGASGICAAGNAAIIRSAISEGNARPTTSAAARFASGETGAPGVGH